MDGVSGALVRDALPRLRWGRKRAGQFAHRYLSRLGRAMRKPGLAPPRDNGAPLSRPAPQIRVVKANIKPKEGPVPTPDEAAELKAARSKKAVAKKLRKKVKKARAKQAAVAAAIAQQAAKRGKPKKKPLTPLQRLERAVGPDDGRRRGGSPFLQGGSPGLGRRR